MVGDFLPIFAGHLSNENLILDQLLINLMELEPTIKSVVLTSIVLLPGARPVTVPVFQSTLPVTLQGLLAKALTPKAKVEEVPVEVAWILFE